MNVHLKKYMNQALQLLGGLTTNDVYVIQTDFIHKNAFRKKVTELCVLSGRGKIISGLEVVTDEDLVYVRVRCMDEESYGEYVNYYVVPRSSYNKFKRVAKEKRNKKEFNIICSDEIRQDFISNTVDFLAHAREAKMYGAGLSKGILLSGPPGNGKTLWCNYLLQKYGHNKARFCSEKDLSDGSVFKSDLKVLIFDDIDVEILTRKDKRAGSILSAMDGIKRDNLQVRVFTTNEKVVNIDDAFLRPGRIDKILTINKPTPELRLKFINTWHENIRKNVDAEYIVSHTEDMSFAELDHVKCSLVFKYLNDRVWDTDFALSCNTEKVKKNVIGFGG